MPRICCQIHALTIRSDFFFSAAPFCLCVRSASINSFKLGNVPGIINLYSRILSPFHIINKFNSWLFLFFIQLPYKFIVFANQFCSEIALITSSASIGRILFLQFVLLFQAVKFCFQLLNFVLLFRIFHSFSSVRYDLLNVTIQTHSILGCEYPFFI